MDRFKSCLFAAAGFVIVVGTMVLSGPATVPAAQPGAVTVTNTVGVKDVDNAARHAFQQVTSATIPIGSFGACGSFTVPAGQQLVIEYVSVFATLDTADTLLSVAVETTVNGFTTDHFVVPQKRANVNPSLPTTIIWLASQQTRLYADPGTTVFGCGQRNDDTVSGNISVRVSGYLVSIP